MAIGCFICVNINLVIVLIDVSNFVISGGILFKMLVYFVLLCVFICIYILIRYVIFVPFRLLLYFQVKFYCCFFVHFSFNICLFYMEVYA